MPDARPRWAGPDLRPFGFVTLATASSMTIETARHGFVNTGDTPPDAVSPWLYGLFAVGWWCAMFVLHRLRAAGDARPLRVLSAAPLVTIVLAFLQTPADLAGLFAPHPVAVVVDLAWPLSMFLTFLVGAACAFAGRLPGAYRFAPLFAGASVPIALGAAALGVSLPGWTADVHIVLGWVMLGLVAFVAGPAPVLPAVPGRAGAPGD